MPAWCVIRKKALNKLFLAFFLGVLFSIFPNTKTHAATLTVNTLVDEDTANANCSIREAITAVNAGADYNGCTNGGAAYGTTDTINFIGLSGTILVGADASALNTQLPAITNTVTIDGTTALGAACGNLWAGTPHTIAITLDGTNVTTAGEDGITISAANTVVRGLAIINYSTNSAEAIRIQGAGDDAIIQCNYLGIQTDGTTPAANSKGIRVNGADNVIIGGDNPGEGNVISGNTTFGLDLDSPDNISIKRNFIGTSADGNTTSVSLGNGHGANSSGIDMADVTNSTIGGTIGATGNIISRSGLAGIYFRSANNDNNTFIGNYIGLDRNGTATTFGNDNQGIQIRSNRGENNTIGSTTIAERNVIAGNGSNGISVHDQNNTIIGNYIGSSADGTISIGNNTGIAVNANNTTIGGALAGQGNLIVGNNGSGITANAVTGLTVRGNYIGINSADTLMSNSSHGININGATGAIIGGTTANERNIISGNGASGINIQNASANGTVVQGNYIGTNTAGTAAIANNTNGIIIGDGSNTHTIGGSGAGEGNIISGNTQYGIKVEDVGTTGVVIQGNYIGTNSGGASIPNTFSGIGFTAGAINNTVGGTTAAEANTIAFNGQDGIGVANSASIGNTFLLNSIHSNTQIGIDLNANDVTANDAGDGDTGPNNLLNFPVFTLVDHETAGNVVYYSYDVPAATAYRIDFYANTTADSTNYGEGEEYVATDIIVGGGSGTANHNLGYAGARSFFSATMTSCDEVTCTVGFGDTSEFSGANVGGIGGTVFLDMNDNDIHNSGNNEPGLEAVTVGLYLDDGDGIFEPGTDDIKADEQDTDASGNYAFTSVAATNAGTTPYTYFVRVEDRANDLFDTTLVGPTQNGFDAITVVLNADNQVSTSNNFPYSGQGVLGNTLFFDADNDGVLDGGETTLGLTGLMVNLEYDVDNDGAFGGANDFTFVPVLISGTGGPNYSFTNLPEGFLNSNSANYRMTITGTILGTGVVTNSLDPDGGGDSTADVGLQESDTSQSTTFNWGYYGDGNIGVKVFQDFDGDGVYDAGEPGIPNVNLTVIIDTDNDGTLETTADDVQVGTITSSSTNTTYGDWAFGGISFFTGSLAGALTDSNADFVADIADPDLRGGTATTSTLFSKTFPNGDEIYTDLNFGFIGSNTIRGAIFNDYNANGVQNGSEPIISGVDVAFWYDDVDDGIINSGTEHSVLAYDGSSNPNVITTDGSADNFSLTRLFDGGYITQIRSGDPIANSMVATNAAVASSGGFFVLDLGSVAGGIIDQDIGFSDDADGDGIPNGLECPTHANDGNWLAGDCEDNDNDGIPNFQDTNSDNNADGLLDSAEAPNGISPADVDSDGIPDYLDLDISGGLDGSGDSDGDGVSDATECPAGFIAGCLNTDGDGLFDYLDTDDDGDGLLTANEDVVTVDGDPTNDNTDGDGLANYLDPDDDGDGINTSMERADPNGDGSPADAINTNGDADATAYTPNTIPDYLDNNDDGEGANTGDGTETALLDDDGDGIPNYLDASSIAGSGDSDGDGVLDNIECPGGMICPDTDGDGIYDYMDTDDDNDGIQTQHEDYWSPGYPAGDPTQTDTDGDGTPDYLDTDDDGDGVLTSAEGADLDNDGDPSNDLNSDSASGDAVPDYLDADSTNVAGTADGSGDSDGDGVSDAIECPTWVCQNTDSTSPTTDNTPNYLDIDDDNDGINTTFEDLDADGDITDDDVDNDGIPNYLDIDDDGDGTNTSAESPDPDANNDPSDAVDTDGDGIPDYLDIDQSGGTPGDSDGDGVADDLEDANGNGNFYDDDSDGDGRLDYLDIDDDNDGIIASLEDANGNGIMGDDDSDGDGIPDYRDRDADNDGIPDAIEAGGVDGDGDGVVGTGAADTDNDGYLDVVDSDNGGTALTALDTDGDGSPNYRDNDSDGDGVFDTLESSATDANADGVIDGFADGDNDGLATSVDTSEGGTAVTFSDRDTDTINNHLDYDPTGYFYNEANGQIISGGSIGVTGPGVVTIIQDGSTGYYQWITDGTAGIYTMTANLPADYFLSTTCAASSPPPFDPTGGPNPTVLGAGEVGSTGVISDFTCANNTYYFEFDIVGGDPFILNNNIPLYTTGISNNNANNAAAYAPDLDVEAKVADVNDNGDGSYLLELVVDLENSGGSKAINIEIENILEEVFAGFDWELIGIPFSDNTDVNDDFKGTLASNDLLTGNRDLGKDEEVNVRYFVRVNLLNENGLCSASSYTFKNEVQAKSDSFVNGKITSKDSIEFTLSCNAPAQTSVIDLPIITDVVEENFEGGTDTEPLLDEVKTGSEANCSETDTDCDGTPNDVEQGAANNGDGNNDGTPDYIQNYVTSAPNPVTNGYTTLWVQGECSTTAGFEVLDPNEHYSFLDAKDYPVGLFDFDLECLRAGGSAEVMFITDSLYNTNTWTYQKVDANSRDETSIEKYVEYGTFAQSDEAEVTTISYKVTDGDGLLDDDNETNGLISDPSGPKDTGCPYLPYFVIVLIVLVGLRIKVTNDEKKKNSGYISNEAK